MKYVILFASLMVCNGICVAQVKLKGSYHIKVDVSKLGYTPDAIAISYHKMVNGEDKRVTDTSRVKDNIAEFRGFTDKPFKDAIMEAIPMKSIGMPVFFLQPGETTIKADKLISVIEVKGMYSPQFNELNAGINSFRPPAADTLTAAEELTSSEDTQPYLLKMTKVERNENLRREVVNKPFVIKYARISPVAVYALNQYAGDPQLLIRPEALKTTDSLFNLLNPEFRKMELAVQLKNRIAQSKRVAIGKMAPDFTQPDTAGRMVSLSSFRGKYVLVDFWASWCHWCRAESPNMIAAYNKYHTNNFEILAVSTDNKTYKAAWMKAIHTDSTGIWTQVCELSDKNSVSALYGVKAIPQTFLIDPQGKIIGVNLRGESLNKKLAEIFK